MIWREPSNYEIVIFVIQIYVKFNEKNQSTRVGIYPDVTSVTKSVLYSEMLFVSTCLDTSNCFHRTDSTESENYPTSCSEYLPEYNI